MTGFRFGYSILLLTCFGVSGAACLEPSAFQKAEAPPAVSTYRSYALADDPTLIRTTAPGVTPSERQKLDAPPPQRQQILQDTFYRTNPKPAAASASTAYRIETSPGTTFGPAPAPSYRENFDQTEQIDASYTFVANSQKTGLGLDLALKPRLSVNDEGALKTTRAGAEVRVGQNLDLRGKNARNANWYFFAGADGEAVVWDIQRTGADITNGQVTLQDRVTIGDVQAGIAWESPAGQMSISYISREFEYRNGAISRSGEEDFAAVTLSWRH